MPLTQKSKHLGQQQSRQDRISSVKKLHCISVYREWFKYIDLTQSSRVPVPTAAAQCTAWQVFVLWTTSLTHAARPLPISHPLTNRVPEPRTWLAHGSLSRPLVRPTGLLWCCTYLLLFCVFLCYALDAEITFSFASVKMASHKGGWTTTYSWGESEIQW